MMKRSLGAVLFFYLSAACCVRAAEPVAIDVAFAKPLTAGEAKRQVLTGDRLALNTFREPKKCVPVETKFAFGGGASFSAELPAYSLSAYRFP